MLQYQWDKNKNLINIEKHGADFKDANLVYENPDKETISGNTHDKELRLIDIAFVNNRLMVLVYTMRDGDVRVISYRKANHPKETELYLKSKEL